MKNGLKYLLGAFYFCFLSNNISAAPSLEETPPNTIESTVELAKGGTPTALEHLLVYTNFPDEPYKVWDLLIYSGKIQANDQDSPIKISQGGLVWMLLKKDELGTQRLVHTQPFEKLFSVTFEENGFMKFAYSEGKLRIKTSNTIIEYEGVTYNVPFRSLKSLLSISINLGMPLYEFTEPGDYTLQIHFIYDFEGKKYKTIFESEEFKVRNNT